MIFTDTVTIYNHYKGAQGQDFWKKTIIKDVMWKRKVERSITSDGRLETVEYISLTIPEPKNYQNPEEWARTRAGWTLNAKSGLDIIALGAQTIELSSNYRLKDFKRDMGDIGTVKAVHTNSNRDCLKHLRVIAV